jgi:hypothetical protein
VRIEMTGSKTKKGLALFTLSIVTLALCFSISGCGTEGSNDQGTSSDASTVTTIPTSLEDAPSHVGNVTQVDTMVIESSAEELFQDANLVCTGTFVSSSAPMLIEPINGADDSYFTDSYFTDVTVYSGTLPSSSVDDQGKPLVTVRQQGGTGTDYAVVNCDAVSFVEGQEYLLFFYRIEDGSGYNTEGDQVYLYGDAQGVWSRSANSDSFVSAADGETITIEDVTAFAQEYPKDDTTETNTLEINYSRILSPEETTAYEEELAEKTKTLYQSQISH